MKAGDLITIDIPNRKIELNISADELSTRMNKLKPFEQKIKHGYLGRYARMVTSANTGAVLQ